MNKKIIAFQHLRAKNDPNGNPQRCYVLINEDGSIHDVINEGYKGLPDRCRGLTELYNVEISRSAYHDFIRIGREKQKPKILEVGGDEDAILQMLDECYPEYKIGNLTFSPSQIIKECDPVALRCMVAAEPIRYQCDDCQEMFDDEDEANEHWTENHNA
jgi:hypothetical protein